ncbi:divergent PAP2 family protein [bacterium]|nr:divergent PAP2 family protein [bacterium]
MLKINKALVIALIADIFAQCVKTVFYYFKTKKWDVSLLFSNGGFPSSHAATVTALSTRIGIQEGIDSTYFAICFIFSLIVLFDAAGVRQEVGKHSKTLNDLIGLLKMKEKVKFVELEEWIGHNTVEVFGGVMIGFLIGWGLGFLPFLSV